MYRSRLIFSVISFAALAAGLILSFWPLALLGLLLAAATGQYAVAIVIGIFMDVTYGAPVGRLYWLSVPFMLLAFVTCALQYYLSVYFRKGDTGLL